VWVFFIPQIPMPVINKRKITRNTIPILTVAPFRMYPIKKNYFYQGMNLHCAIGFAFLEGPAILGQRQGL
jgi:hypothetical protein